MCPRPLDERARSPKLYQFLKIYVTLKLMRQHFKKNLLLKLSLVIVTAVSLPILLAIFITPDPVISLVAGLFSVTLAILMIFIALKPVDSIIQGSKILTDGNLRYRIDIRSGDELEELASSFNFLAQTLNSTKENLETEKVILSSEKNKLSLILSSVIDGILAIDGQRNISLVNKAAEQMTGFTQTELEGKPLDSLIHLFSQQGEVDPKTYCQTDFGQNLTLVGKDGKKVKINLTSQAIAEGIQTNLSCILMLHDLTNEQQLEQMKLDFVSMASHELKTPLTSIIGYLSVFISENKDKLKPDALELLTRAESSTKQLAQLIENLLSVNKIERESLTVRIEPLDYAAVLEKTVEDIQYQAKLKNITLTLRMQTDMPKVMADSLRIVEVINNLVANAIHYTNPNGSILVSTKVSPSEVTTCVEDTGIGIPKEALPHLFNKFFIVSSNLQAAEKGTGLGLYISKSIVEKLGGKIWVESEIGKGSKFYFSLPTASKTLDKINTQKFISESIQHGGLSY